MSKDCALNKYIVDVIDNNTGIAASLLSDAKFKDCLAKTLGFNLFYLKQNLIELFNGLFNELIKLIIRKDI